MGWYWESFSDSTGVRRYATPGGPSASRSTGTRRGRQSRWRTFSSIPLRQSGSTRGCFRRSQWSGAVPEALWESTAIPRRCLVLYGRAMDGAYYRAGEDGWTCGVDIFGIAFFMLSRYEELVVRDGRDEHGRFPSSASVACRGGFLERPIVNEYVEILWLMLRQLWPGLRRKTREHRVLLSHDVDEPLAVVGRRPLWVLRNVLADMAIRRDFELAVRRVAAYIAAGQGAYDSDPCNTFNFVMEVSEQYGRQSAFYFFADRGSETMDGACVFEDPWIKKLMR